MSRNYFGAADAYNGTVNVNGVCFSVYGTLPRNLIRRHAKQGQGQGRGRGQSQGQGHSQSQGQNEVEGQKPSDMLSDGNRTLQRQPAPSPPKRTNSIKTDLQRPSENNRESTLTRRHREATPSVCEVNEKASDNESWMRRQDNDSWYSAAGNELPLTFTDGDVDTIKHRTTTPATPLQVNSASDETREDSVSENGDSTVVLDREFDGGTIKRREKCTTVSNSQETQPVTARDGLEMSLHGVSVRNDEVVALNQEFDGGTIKCREKCTVVSNCQETQPVTARDGLEMSLHGVSVRNDDVVVVDQEFDSGTIKRRKKHLAVSSSSKQTHPVTTLKMSVHADEVVVLDQEFDGGTVKRRHTSTADINSRFTDSLTTDFS